MSTAEVGARPAGLRTPLPRPAAPEVEPRPRRRIRRVERPRVAGSAVLITVVAVLLAGIVALNVAALGLQVRLDELARQQGDLRAENAALASELSSGSATPQIEALARKRLGLVRAEAGATTFVPLPAAVK